MCRTQIGAKVELGCKKNCGQEKGQNGYSRCRVMHVLSKTELRQEWLRGQGAAVRLEQPRGAVVRLSCYTDVCSSQNIWTGQSSFPADAR